MDAVQSVNRHGLSQAVMCLILLPLPAGAQEVLRVSVSTSWNMPFADFSGDRMATGILPDLYRAVAKKTGLALAPVILPRKRIDGAAVNGDIDLRCYFNPRWTQTPELYEWSKPLFTSSDVLFSHEGVPELKGLDELGKGVTISTVLGYTYPSLDPILKTGGVLREDAVDEEKVLLKLTAGRTNYGVVNSATLDWYRRITPQHRLANWRLVMDSTDFYCAVPKSATLPAARLLGALEDLRKNGTIDSLLRKYR